MCKCVDFGSTNTSFFSARFIRESPQWLQVGAEVGQTLTPRSERCQTTWRVGNAAQGEKPTSASRLRQTPDMGFAVCRSPVPLLGFRENAGLGDGRDDRLGLLIEQPL